MSCACVKARTELESRPEGLELADLFCRQATLRAEALFHDLWDNADSVEMSAAKRVLAGRYLSLEEGIVPAPSDGPSTAPWSPGPSTEEDVRRRF
jgi:hypothetical protein